MGYINTVMEPPKQLEGVGKGKYCWNLVCKNVQANIDLFKFPHGDTKLQLYKLWFNKTKIFCSPGGKDSFQVTDNTCIILIFPVLILLI